MASGGSIFSRPASSLSRVAVLHDERENAAFSFHHSIVIPNYSMSAALQSGKMMRENKSTTTGTTSRARVLAKPRGKRVFFFRTPQQPEATTTNVETSDARTERITVAQGRQGGK